MDAIPPAQCATKLKSWIDTYTPGGDELILCDVDADANGKGDTYERFHDLLYCYIGSDPNCLISQRCSGVPMNFYIDRGMYFYRFICGKYTSGPAPHEAPIIEKLPPERCD